MASKGDVGIDLDVAKVPLREADMEPFEIMISESQERMLCVVEPDRLEAVLAVCRRWETNATPIGVVTDTFAPARVRRRASWSATCRLPRSWTNARSTTSSPSSRPNRLAFFAPPAPADRSRRGRPRTRCGAARLAQRRQPAVGVRAVRLPGRQPHGDAARSRRTQPCCAWRTTGSTPAGRSRSRSTATGAGWPAIPTSAPPRRSASAPPTSPAWAPSRSA